MLPKNNVKPALIALAAGATASSCVHFQAELENPLAKTNPKPTTKQPNILIIAVDDLRTELGCYGDPNVKSPNIDALATKGVLFKRAYCQQAVCAPSRISLLTGLRPDTTGIVDLKHPLRKTKPNTLSMPQYFRENGYTTISLGKIYHHYNDDEKLGWSEHPWHPEDIKNKKWKGPGYFKPEVWKARRKRGKSAENVKICTAYEIADNPDNEYPDGQTADKAIETMKRLKKEGGPFLLCVGFKKPHLPFCAPKKYWNIYPMNSIKLPEQKNWPKGMPAIAPNGKNGNWEISNYPGIPHTRPLPDELAKTLIRGYRACVTFTDAQIGKVIKALDRLELDRNTIIVLFGDHGWKLDEYSAWCKHTNFELDTHAPLIIAAPGKRAGAKTNALVEFVDIFPTLCQLTSLPIPKTCDGTSMTPILDNPGKKWKQAAFSQYPRWPNIMGYTIRSGKWRYTEWINKKTGEITARELYDHSKSPVAKENLADKPEHEKLVGKLSKILDKGQGWKKIRAELTP